MSNARPAGDRVARLEPPIDEPKTRHVWLHAEPRSGLPGEPAFLVAWSRQPGGGPWWAQVVRVDGTGDFRVCWVHADMISPQRRLPGGLRAEGD